MGRRDRIGGLVSGEKRELPPVTGGGANGLMNTIMKSNVTLWLY